MTVLALKAPAGLVCCVGTAGRESDRNILLLPAYSSLFRQGRFSNYTMALDVAEEESESLIGSTDSTAESVKPRKSISPSHPHPQKLKEILNNNNNDKDHKSFLRFAKLVIVGFPYVALLICLNSKDIMSSELSDESTYQPKHANVTGYVRPNVIYGHVHIAKAGGTSLNGILANKFERVCGHKGSSYDAYQKNEKAKKAEENGGSLIRGNFGVKADKYFRLGKAGFEDCDYISQEKEYGFWHEQFPNGKLHGVPVELHVPCRDPLDHLLSQCNFRKETRRLPCDSDADQSGALYSAIEACILSADRFHRKLTETFSVKCFDFKKQFTEYTSYISTTLQSRRFEPDRVVTRMTNKPRNRTDECIWDHPDLLKKTRDYLMHNYTSDDEKRKHKGDETGGLIILSDYYRFCDECIGSKDDLTRGTMT